MSRRWPAHLFGAGDATVQYLALQPSERDLIWNNTSNITYADCFLASHCFVEGTTESSVSLAYGPATSSKLLKLI